MVIRLSFGKQIFVHVLSSPFWFSLRRYEYLSLIHYLYNSLLICILFLLICIVKIMAFTRAFFFILPILIGVRQA